MSRGRGKEKERREKKKKKKGLSDGERETGREMGH